MEMESSSLPLNNCHVLKFRLAANRLHSIVHGVALLFLFHYRLTQIFNRTSIFPHLLMFTAEAILAFIWFLNQPSRWTPIVRKAFPERLAGDEKLPSVDVFVCTADPSKEPSLKVMNTVISAMALDYPPEKLNVYISDDGGSAVTLRAAEQAWIFAKIWIPFCRKYEVKKRCPEAYFLKAKKVNGNGKVYSSEFILEKKEIQERYLEFKSRISEIVAKSGVATSRDHPPVIEVISENENVEEERRHLPFLAYVAREKRPFHPHHFKAGALNVLLRVSAMITNSPYILVLDCDMYCNDPSSARQAMCFHLDSKLSPNLGFVQFPQKFYNVSKNNDIYSGHMRSFWEKWQGLDGILGPILSGTCFYIKRKALYGTPDSLDDQGQIKVADLNKCFGSSNGFITSINRNYDTEHPNCSKILDNSNEIRSLASCNYDEGTDWGQEVGFRYSVVEDYFTGFKLHCSGWTSVYIDPTRPCFLGASPITLGEHMFQHMRWYFGLSQIGLSRFSPLLYGSSRMSFWQSVCYADLAHTALYFVPLYMLAVVPQLCLLLRVALYPEVSSLSFGVFLFVFFSSQAKHMQEVLSTGHSIRSWLGEQRMWMFHSLAPYLYATTDVVLEKIGMRAANFSPTNKVVDGEQEERYRMGLYDFRASAAFMVPLCSIYALNVASFAVGLRRILNGDGDGTGSTLGQWLLPLYGVVLHFPLLEGMLFRKDKGRVSPFVTIMSAAVCVAVFLSANRD
ncbi:cellulose synthase-like protein G2 [Andrographis paniculata]|uniref:cellulose synthase-like protein G2 n=1 Tax=Andrographis paniculata TaxID=175694 RepID=UPI0021E71E8B|nr:cellulose synthase-like protein G2 [Andrographis paniculata]